MKKTEMIKRKYEFKILFSKGKIFYGMNVNMYFQRNKLKFNKLGIAVSKKSGKAVHRNKIKRLIRENYKLFEDNIGCGYNILFSVNKNIDLKEIDFYDIQKDMRKLFYKSKLLNELV